MSDTPKIEYSTVVGPWVSRITIARLYNLGDYEHKRIELVVEMPHGQDVAKTLTLVEGLLERFEHTPPNDFERYPLEQYAERQKFTLDQWEQEYPPASWPNMDPPKWKLVFEEESKALAMARQENAVWERQQELIREQLNKLGSLSA